MLPDPDKIPLPETVQAVADVIGRQDALRLAKACKHRALYVPHVIRPGHRLHTLLGDAKAKALAREFCGLLLPMATCKIIDIAARNRRAVQAIEQGRPIGSVAQELGVTYELVRVIWREHKAGRCANWAPRLPPPGGRQGTPQNGHTRVGGTSSVSRS